jgi:hypothetical protein
VLGVGDPGQPDGIADRVVLALSAKVTTTVRLAKVTAAA